jgi:glycosyltransferase involved in cell wall biosynthesis
LDLRVLCSPRQLGKAVLWALTFWRLPDRLEGRRRFQREQHALMANSDMQLRTNAADISAAPAEHVQIVASSELFDAEGYAAGAGLSIMDGDPAAHYLVIGEALGLAASAKFDARLYAEANPDVAETGANCLVHFELYGRAEGRALAPEVETSARERSEAEILRRSPLFDAVHYAAQLPEYDDVGDLALHYLRHGEAAGLTPSLDFDPQIYRDQNEDIAELKVNALLHFELYGRAEGRRSGAAPKRPRELKFAADAVRNSRLFDPDYYVAQVIDQESIDDPALHYVEHGEPMGLLPSRDFDPLRYRQRNDDVSSSEINALVHFELYGRAEGRFCPAPVKAIVYPAEKIRADRKTVLLLLHEATYTGAPILGWNLAKHLSRRWNVVVVLSQGGDLTPAFAPFDVVGPLGALLQDADEMKVIAAALKRTYAPHFVIANSVETQTVALALMDEDVPVIVLVHEFASHALPIGSLASLMRRADEIVFPAFLVRQSAIDCYRDLQLRKTHVLPQGPSEVPRLVEQRASEPLEVSMLLVVQDRAPLTLSQALAVDAAEDDRPFIVIGLGNLNHRKGMDLFVSTATTLMHRHPSRNFRFIWVGDSRHFIGSRVGVALEEQVARSGLGDRLVFMPPVDDLSPVYAHADALFLSSRLDPLPNVAIEAALKGIPVVCFRHGTGLAEFLETDPDTARLVVPYMDLYAAADAFMGLIDDDAAYRKVSEAIQRLAHEAFDFEHYARSLEKLGDALADRMPAELARRATDVYWLAQPGGLDAEYLFGDRSLAHFGCAAREVEPEAAAEWYLRSAEKVNLGLPAVRGYSPARTRPGFNACTYAHKAEDFPKDGSRDPLAHFIEHGQPEGPWLHDVIRLDDSTLSCVRPSLSVALHGHFHYTDNIGELLDGIRANRAEVDLFLTTTSHDSANRLAGATKNYDKGSVLIEIGPNRGRDVGPFIRVLKDHILGRYEVVGHLHGKRSVFTHHFDPELGDRWRNFLWQHLLGPQQPALDIILEHFAKESDLGLVFPENEHIIGWELDRPVAETIAKKIGIDALSDDLEFPVGTMFWARSEALRPLTDLGLTDADYPAEPLPVDGTILHALERLLPVIAQHSNFRYATTYTPRVRR